MAYNFQNLNILLVEDDNYMRFLVRDILKIFGIDNIRAARDGTAGYQELRNFPADIVIIDWLMKPMNGLDFLHKLRNSVDSPNPYVPTIMLTAFTDIERVMVSRDTGITEFLAKPFTPQKLYDRIVSVIEDQRMYVRSDTYFGPDRRRADRPYVGLDRRQSGEAVDSFDLDEESVSLAS
jgi:DNA-binding response OmpR family regulator